MTAKEFLRQYEYADKRVHRLEIELEEERIMIDAVRSLSDNDGLPHGTNITRPTEERAVRLADKSLELIQARLDAVEVRQKVFNIIDQIDGDPGEVLFQRYILLKRWEEVCLAVHKSWRSTHRSHAAGLDMVSALISNNGIEWHTTK